MSGRKEKAHRFGGEAVRGLIGVCLAAYVSTGDRFKWKLKKGLFVGWIHEIDKIELHLQKDQIMLDCSERLKVKVPPDYSSGSFKDMK